MTNQVNQEAIEKWWYGTDANLILCSRNSAEVGYQAATQASESEINSLKQRVESYKSALEAALEEKEQSKKDERTAVTHYHELQADNLRLREALERIVKAEDNIYKCEDDYQGDVIGKLSDIHFKAYNKARKVLSSTPAQSLAEHELIKSQRDKLLASLKLALIEMMALPHSLGLEITHTIDMELLIKEVEESK